MILKEYKFGEITINDETYENDLYIVDGTIHPNWWRKEGHKLHLEDITEILSSNPHTLVIGTGFYGRMKLTDEVKEELDNIGCQLIAKKTKQAVEIFNDRSDRENIACAFHLTC